MVIYKMNALVTSIIVYILLMICLYAFKPKLCFCNDGKMKKFGIGKNKTPFTFLSISIILGIFSLVISVIYQDYFTPTVEDVIKEAKEIIQETQKTIVN